MGFFSSSSSSNPKYDTFEPPPYAPPSTSHFDPLYSNASDDDRDLGDHFCASHPLYPPVSVDEAKKQRAMVGNIRLVQPPLLTIPTNNKLAKRFKGEVQDKNPGEVYIRSKKDTKDCVFVSDVPMLAPMTYRSAQIYYEVTITSLPHPKDAAIAIGFTCLPYPPFRLPGWHRGSLAVHSDDGRRYVNDSLSGIDFTRPFSQGETVGLGIDFVKQSVFFTRNGNYDSEWALANAPGVDPYRQYRDGSIEGINETDIYAAVGIYGSVGVAINFKSFKYQLYKP